MFDNLPWGFVVVGGPIILAIVLAWAALSNRGRRTRDKAAAEQGARDLRAEIDREDKARDRGEDPAVISRTPAPPD